MARWSRTSSPPCATLAICLALDAWDVVRWLRGERFVLGTKEAHRAGASNLSNALARG